MKLLFTKLHQLKKDKRGVSAVEFALVLPILLMIYLGTVEISQGLTVSRNTTNTASTVADLIGQASVLTTANINTIFKASESIINPFSTNSMQLYASSYCRRISNNQIVKDWGQHYNSLSSSLTTGDTSIVNLLPNAGDSLIVVEAKYTYTFISPARAIFTMFSPSNNFTNGNTGFIIRDKFFVRPRNVSYVKKVGVSSQCNS